MMTTATQPSLAIPAAPERLVGYLQSRLGSRQAGVKLWHDVKAVLANPLVQKACDSPAFRQILANKSRYVSVKELEAEILRGSLSFKFGLGVWETLKVTNLLLPWERHRETLQGLVAEYAKISGLPEGMSALEMGLYLTTEVRKRNGKGTGFAAEAATQAVFQGVEAMIGRRS